MEEKSINANGTIKFLYKFYENQLLVEALPPREKTLFIDSIGDSIVFFVDIYDELYDSTKKITAKTIVSYGFRPSELVVKYMGVNGDCFYTKFIYTNWYFGVIWGLPDAYKEVILQPSEIDYSRFIWINL